MNRRYSELVRLQTFRERFEYVKCSGIVGDQTFGSHRYLNQILYSSDRWKKIRREVIIRDDGFDLGHPDYPIGGYIYVHHINPITVDDILNDCFCVFDLENLVSTSFQTHNAIHYGRDTPRQNQLIIRKPNDTCPWKR